MKKLVCLLLFAVPLRGFGIERDSTAFKRWGIDNYVVLGSGDGLRYYVGSTYSIKHHEISTGLFFPDIGDGDFHIPMPGLFAGYKFFLRNRTKKNNFYLEYIFGYSTWSSGRSEICEPPYLIHDLKLYTNKGKQIDNIAGLVYQFRFSNNFYIRSGYNFRFMNYWTKSKWEYCDGKVETLNNTSYYYTFPGVFKLGFGYYFPHRQKKTAG